MDCWNPISHTDDQIYKTKIFYSISFRSQTRGIKLIFVSMPHQIIPFQMAAATTGPGASMQSLYWTPEDSLQLCVGNGKAQEDCAISK